MTRGCESAGLRRSTSWFPARLRRQPHSDDALRDWRERSVRRARRPVAQAEPSRQRGVAAFLVAVDGRRDQLGVHRAASTSSGEHGSSASSREMQSSNTRSIGPYLCEPDHEQIDRLPVLAQLVDDIIEAGDQRERRRRRQCAGEPPQRLPGSPRRRLPDRARRRTAGSLRMRKARRGDRREQSAVISCFGRAPSTRHSGRFAARGCLLRGAPSALIGLANGLGGSLRHARSPMWTAERPRRPGEPPSRISRDASQWRAMLYGEPLSGARRR